MNVLVTSMNEKDPIKIEGATVAKTLNINFSNKGSCTKMYSNTTTIL